MRKETIAKIQIIFGILLVITLLTADYYFKSSITDTLQRGSSAYISTATEFAMQNKTSGAIGGLFVMGHGFQSAITIQVAAFLGILLNIIILAQAIMFILSGLKCLAKE